jgi:hypothetical protein
MRLASRAIIPAFLAAASLLPARAEALDKFEIQVYQGEHNEPGELSLELHTNFTPAGHGEPAYLGETPPKLAFRTTLELAYGLTEWLELGMYLQGMLTPDHGVQYGGWKGRVKLIAPSHWLEPLILGLNVELGIMPLAAEDATWSNELRPIIGLELGALGLSLNPIITYALSGPEAKKPALEPAAKAKLNTGRGFSLGLEYYAGLGLFSEGFKPASEHDHLLFLAFDLERPIGEAAQASDWELNVGLGKSLSAATPQDWVLKVILGHAL